jgi:hypothetical protein
MRVNEVNFLRWDDGVPNPGLPRLPYAYWRDRARCGYMPIALPSESCSFYINTKTGLRFEEILELETELDAADLRLVATRASDGFAVDTNLGPLVKHVFPDNASRYNLHSTFVWPDLPEDVYNLQIMSGDLGVTLLTSNPIRVRTDQQKLYDTTTFCRFRHDRSLYNIRYHDLPGFYQQFRLNMSVVDEQVIGTNEVYDEVSTTDTVLAESREKLMTKLETYYFDRDSHIAAAIMVKHEFLELNGSLYSFKDEYKYTPNPLSKLSKGEVEVYNRSFTALNRC